MSDAAVKRPAPEAEPQNAPGSDAEALRPAPEPESIVWKQFKKRPVGVFALGVILVLFAIAVYAPILANQNPLALKTTYGPVYSYYYAGWKTVHTLLADSTAGQDTLRKELQDAEKGYEANRETLKKLTVEYNTVGDRYDQARTEANRIQDQLDELGEQEAALKEQGDTAGLERIAAQKEALQAKKKEKDEPLKVSGGEKQSLKRKLDEARAEQDAHNQAILRARFRLDFPQHLEAIQLNLAQMKFAVDGPTQEKLDALGERYAAIESSLGGSGPAAGELAGKLEQLRQDVESQVSPEVAKQNLTYRWTFPAFAQLDGVDRFFMIGYALLLAAFLAGRRVRGTAAQKVAGVAVLAAVAAVVLQPLSSDLPARNYKNLFLENAAAYPESSVVMAPVPYGMSENRIEEKLQRPGFVADELGRRSMHLLGTDDYGRDVTSRMVWGARVSLSVGFVAVTIYVLLGTIIGAFAGFFGGRVDLVISRVIEVVICFPSFFLILSVIAFIGPSIYNVMVVIGLTSWTGIARLTRAEFLRLRNLEYVLAARASGVSELSIMFRYILPNALTPVLVSAVFGFAGSILIESSLSYLGFGVQEPFPSWGQMLSDSQGNPLLYWWLFIVPGIALFLTVTFYNIAGNTLRDAADPRLRQ